MTALAGLYQNGSIKLDEEYLSIRPVKVIVTFLEEEDTATEKDFALMTFHLLRVRKF